MEGLACVRKAPNGTARNVRVRVSPIVRHTTPSRGCRMAVEARARFNVRRIARLTFLEPAKTMAAGGCAPAQTGKHAPKVLAVRRLAGPTVPASQTGVGAFARVPIQAHIASTEVAVDRHVLLVLAEVMAAARSASAPWGRRAAMERALKALAPSHVPTAHPRAIAAAAPMVKNVWEASARPESTDALDAVQSKTPDHQTSVGRLMAGKLGNQLTALVKR